MKYKQKTSICSMNPTITIIVPVYNVEAYVRKSLQSIADQTFTNWECIVVDDGSTDGSGAICDEFAARDPRFKVIHQQNKGLPGARNSGMDIAQGRYIGFIDSDDYIHPDMYKVLLEAIEKTDADLAISQVRMVNSMEEQFLPNPPLEFSVKTREQMFYHWFVEPFARRWMAMVWNKLYRRELIGNERFAPMVPGQDQEFNMRMCIKCNRAVTINHVLYHWVIRDDSISWADGVARHQYEVLIILKKCGVHRDKMTETERGFYSIDLMKRYLKARRANKNHKDVLRKVQEERPLVKAEFFSNSSIPVRYKAIMVAMFYCPWLYDGFINFFEIKAKIAQKLNRQ